MNKIITALIISFFSFTAISQSNIYSFKVKTLEGELFDFSTLKGKKVIIVNTASKCGFTPQYEQLEELFKKYGPDKFIIIGFPANNFLKQEPGTNEQIREFCTLNYGVTFPMMEKISVKGDDIHPIYQWLTQKEKNGVKDSKVGWNFQKYLINEKGELVDVMPPKIKPNDLSIIEWIEKK
ncbi:MAG: glutathione peroxidase [Marinilabiliaceae bacterium]|nr:glutathione peroxidase [Marinilabiliaceae bacterium]